MLEDGLVEEVRALKSRGCNRNMTSMKGLGYKEILAYLDGETTLEEAVRILSGIRDILQNARSRGLNGRGM